jgi:hypothetical protein
MIHEPPDTISPRNEQLMVPLDRAQRRRLLVHAIGWLGLGGILVAFSCIYGPLAINWLLPATSGLLMALMVGIVIALVDVAEVWVLLFGLALLQEALFGSAIQATETLDRAQSLLPIPYTLRGVQIGRLRAATSELLVVTHPGERHSITYSPRARMLWACSVIDQTEASQV